MSGLFPDEMKSARVTPLFKGGDKLDMENFRPISVLSYFSTTLKKIMCSIIAFNNSILYKKQFDFQENHSMNMQLFN